MIIKYNLFVFCCVNITEIPTNRWPNPCEYKNDEVTERKVTASDSTVLRISAFLGR